MMKTISSRIMLVGRATIFTVGLAVMLAVTLGVAATALAAVPGDPFRLGRANTVNAASQLVGTVAGPMLRIDNNGTGPALSLEARAGRTPLAVNAAAGKATNLNADRLDGKDATDFLASGAKAADAAHADAASNADRLDGKDASEFVGAGQPAMFASGQIREDASIRNSVGPLVGGDSGSVGHPSPGIYCVAFTTPVSQARLESAVVGLAGTSANAAFAHVTNGQGGGCANAADLGILIHNASGSPVDARFGFIVP